MKTNITTIIAAVALIASFSASASEIKPSKSEPAMISKIQASGNVEVYISQGDVESVKVEGEYDADQALIASEDGELKIASYAKEPLKLIVTVTSLKSISADGNAHLISTNKLSDTLEEVSLSDSASALLDTGDSDFDREIGESATLLLNGKN